jgi:hypothetical protein
MKNDVAVSNLVDQRVAMVLRTRFVSLRCSEVVPEIRPISRFEPIDLRRIVFPPPI